ILDENTFWGIDDDQGDHDEAASVCVLPDGGYCLIGGTTAEGVEVMDVLIIKVNADLEEDWKTAIEPGNLHDFGKCVCRYLLDGNLLICGTTRYAQPLTNDLFLVKMDLQGNVVSSDLFGDDGSEGGFALCETAEGNCVVAGQTNSQGNGGYDVWLFMISGVTPDFEAEPHSGVAPQTIQFTDHSLGNIDTWNWDFNSDSIIDSYEQNPSWTFQIPGSYSVTLTVEFGDYSISCFKQDFITVFNLDSALYYSGLESYSKCYADPAINITGPLTIEAWVTPQDWGNFYNKILDKNSFTFFLSESFPVYNEYCLVFQMLHQNGELSRSYTADYSVATAGAQHLAVTYDGDQDIHIYINGVNQELYYLNEPEGTISDNLLDDLYIGNDASCNFPCNGIVDELRVWNIVRTPTEINDNMFYYLSGSENGLVGYFKFNEGNGYEINDLSGNLLPGYISNPQWVQGVILLPVSNDDAEIPQLFRPALFNYPNPFNPVTIFQYYLPESDNVKLQVFNLRGQQVDILVNGYLEAGIHHYSWHAGELPAGIYFGQMITSKIKINRKMVILK
ncbi:MAG: T9SS type A sorting domain-containing protein, partial [Candidatus Cloacimonetes bacterium]|nr:T9SS type A sorting domain-containing protein [Candidatus Cloacimonadota bacterium]